MKKPAVRAWTYVADRPWAITEDALRQILEIAARASQETSESWEAVAAKLGKPLENTWSVEIRDGVAIVPVAGPLFRYANLFTMFSGATSIQDLATDFQAAVDDLGVRAIVLNHDTPGGEMSGVNEFADMVAAAAAAKKKPVVAYAGGMAASGGLWIASQAQRIVVDPTALLGSIGVVATIPDQKAMDEKRGIKKYEIVSSQSPKKRLDLATDAGKTEAQSVVDALAEEFIAKVAAGRGVTRDKVLADFGQGGTMTGRRAVAVGMADSLGSLEGLITELKTVESRSPVIFDLNKSGSAANLIPGGHMAEENKPAENTPAVPPAPAAAAQAAAPVVDVAAEKKGAVISERARISAILNCEEAKGRETLARTIALETELDVEAAKKMLAAAPLQMPNPAKSPLQEAMTRLPNPKVGEGAGEENDEKAAIAGCLQFATRKVKAS